mgnify:CR=1 FL=1
MLQVLLEVYFSPLTVGQRAVGPQVSEMILYSLLRPSIGPVPALPLSALSRM